MERQRTDRAATVNAVLDRYRLLTLDAMLAHLPSKEPRAYLYDLLAAYPLRPGKGLRPALCIATCRAFGGRTEAVLRSAVAIELFHNAFLIHDDVEDGSEHRRGSPTLHAEHGVPIAVNAGDALNVLSISLLMGNLDQIGPRLTWRVFTEIEHMVRESVEGQALELGWVRDNVIDLTTADYLRMTLKKTCWYTCIHPLRIGALVGSGGTADLDAFNRLGYYMGAAFQIQDDILNLVGDVQRYGKEIDGDIWEGKRTLMLLHAYETADARDKDRLQRLLATPRSQRTADQIAWARALMDRQGSIDAAREIAAHLAAAALREFTACYEGLPDSEHRRFIGDVVLYMIERDL